MGENLKYCRSIQYFLTQTVVGLLLALLVGCSSSSVIKPYPARLGGPLDALASGRPASAYQELSAHVEGPDQILYLQERGRVAQIEERFEASRNDFETVAQIIETDREGAVISISDSLVESASILLNDNAIAYTGKPFEKVFVHTYQALNYLAMDDLEGAMVEMRRARKEQEYLEGEYAEAVYTAKEGLSAEQAETGISDDALSDLLSPAHEAMHRVVGRAKEGYQNGFTFILAAVIWEMSGDLQAAYIDYKKALELFPDNPFIIQAVFRLAEELDLEGDLQYYRSTYGNVVPAAAEGDEGRCIIILEQGVAPPKQELRIPYFYNGRSYQIALPYYAGTWTFPEHCVVTRGETVLGETATICIPSAFAAKELMERYPVILIRQVLRLIAKDQVQKQAYNQSEFLGVLTAIANLLLERADLRSWLTLPDNVQYADFALKPGTHTLELQFRNGRKERVQVEIEPRGITMIRCVDLSETIYIQKF